MRITSIGSRVFNLEYGRGGNQNYDKIARLRDQYQKLEERKRRLNEEIAKLQDGLYK